MPIRHVSCLEKAGLGEATDLKYDHSKKKQGHMMCTNKATEARKPIIGQ